MKLTLSVLLLVVLAACGGGGGSSSIVPSHGVATNSGSVTMKLVIPTGAATALAKATAQRTDSARPMYLSPSIASMKLWLASGNPGSWSPISAYNGQSVALTPSTNPNCTTGAGGTTCTLLLAGIPYGGVGAVMSFYDTSGNYLGGTGSCSPPYDTNSTCPGGPSGSNTYQIVANVGAGSNSIVPLTISGAVAKLTVQQPHSFVEGVPSSMTLQVAAYDSDGNLVVGNAPYTTVSGTPLDIAFSGPSGDPYTVAISGCSDGETAWIDVPSCTATLTYNGTGLQIQDQGQLATGNVRSGITIRSNGVGNFASFFPVVLPATTTTSGPFALAANQTTTYPLISSSADLVTENDGCFGVATTTFSQSSGSTAANVQIQAGGSPGSCTVTTLINDPNLWREKQIIPVTVGGAPNPLAYEVQPAALSFASPSSASQNIGVAQYDDSGATTGPAGIITPLNWCVGPSITITDFSGTTQATNSTAASNVVSIPTTSATLTGTQTANFPATPVGPGMCEYSIFGAGLPPATLGDGNRYYITVGY